MALIEQSRFPRITRHSRVQGGEPIIRGTRIAVRAVIVAWREHRNLSTLLEAYPRLAEEDVKEVLRYYEMHRQEIDELIRTQLIDA
jgi:uncharacterized protein (DUF433 family)